MTKSELLNLCKKQNPHAQRELYDLYKTRLMGVSRRYAQSREEAQDILQDAFFKIFMKIDQVGSDDKLEAWMTRVTLNTAINHYRERMKKYDHLGLQEFDLVIDDEELILSNLSNEKLLGLVNNLPDGARIVFNLVVMEGYTHVEIAKMLGITEGTSRSQFHYARTLLKSELKKNGMIRYGKYA